MGIKTKIRKENETMTYEEQLTENFHKCLDWIREHKDKIGIRPLYIGWGDVDYDNEKNIEFQGREFSLSLGACDLPVAIRSVGIYYYHTYGYTQEQIDKWTDLYNKSGMECPNNRYTFENVPIGMIEKFLVDWQRIRDAITIRVRQIQCLSEPLQMY